jgi:hypothetical protein
VTKLRVITGQANFGGGEKKEKKMQKRVYSK